ncbi:flagellar biosynthesis anti-sigma factor FlgM [Bacillus sp. 1780r2a1]|uniref:flagellar biosynthesis anti-sigma factor FlgM n=1 Tax=Priestia TaxID=2800373 RepID=UPI001B31C767|nr:flagellar biosynthesis anti-sigma factor FlgM [Priestia flexa]USY55004.1 flagellar biosynthesis anti-sigma factor FlgM [Bacillus sp. 1780r2a1]
MKINSTHSSRINPYQKAAEKMEKAQQTGKRDGVQISKEAKELQQMSTKATEHSAKVEQLKQQIENGTYKVNAEEVAKGLINFYKK